MYNTNEMLLGLQHNSTQFPGGSSSSQVLDVVIGLDWGTSSTKMVIRTPFHASVRSYVVDFSDVRPSANPYLVPSVMYALADGQISLRKRVGAREITRIKLRLLNAIECRSTEDEDIQAEACAFLALMLDYARSWFIRTHGGTFRQFRLRWSLNIGIPSESYDKGPMVQAYCKVAKAAWELSTRFEPVSLLGARKCLATPSNQNGRLASCERIEVIPEVAAQVVGYARSPHRQQGLHMLIDVGAMTVDIAGFKLIEQVTSGDHLYSFYTAGVQRLGGYMLHQERVAWILGQLKDRPFNSAIYAHLILALKRLEDPLRAIPSSVANYLPDSLSPDPHLCMSVDTRFGLEVRKMLQSQIVAIRKVKDPNALAWKTGLPIFLTGGGQEIALYYQAIREADTWWQENTGIHPFNVVTLPKPDQLEAEYLDESDYHRVSVAYGLSHPADDIGEIRPHTEIADIHQNPHQGPLREGHQYANEDCK